MDRIAHFTLAGTESPELKANPKGTFWRRVSFLRKKKIVKERKPQGIPRIQPLERLRNTQGPVCVGLPDAGKDENAVKGNWRGCGVEDKGW